MARWRRPMYSALKWKRPKIWLFILLAIFLYLGIRTFMVIEGNLRPTIMSIAEARAKVIATETINNAINQNIAQKSRYEHLIFIQKDNQGNIAMAEVNNAEVARIQALTTISVQSALNEIQAEKLKIPLGQALGSDILANYGPKISVGIVPVGTVTAEMSQSFETSGINVISHQVGIDITANVQIVVPFMSTEVSVKTFSPVVTATYFGQVPDTVINLPLPNDFQFPISPPQGVE